MRSRRSRRRKVNGIVLVNKKAGVTSSDVVKQVSKLYNAKKAGHTGTLDPFATGLLPVCLGEATKVSGLLLASDKRYRATLQLGTRTDTADHDGEVMEQCTVPELSEDQIKQVLTQFQGVIEQVPPMYSSIKHQGRSLHTYARQGIEVERQPRQVDIKSLQLLSFDGDLLVFDVLCSKGTYIRVLGEDIAQALGTVGHLVALHRTQTGVFDAQSMLDIEEIARYRNSSLKSLDIALTEYDALYLTQEQKEHLWMGGFLFDIHPEKQEQDHFVRLYDEHEQIFALGEWDAGRHRLKIKRGFNLDSSDTQAR